MKKNITIKELQNYIKKKDYKPEMKHAYFQKLIEEVGELAEVLRKDKRLEHHDTIKGTIEEELYDVLYYVVGIANVYNIDLEKCFYLKEELNKEKYKYITDASIEK
ncbi:MazG nucleotide pyrophosphohydrolase domain-containing protein [Lederbergia wuyishanensis]|uniref:NTP pyrophosphatase (Non-canonical NTP hydrolase) n=1 Tax=Lederbergia wuyishanensis TaxID=1347903 RepID=A0ABU0D5A4_9BACI|nr:MazG nucleotide pyrophosphohydrolase domain-containing protein [Lederbergia wuyishanensis]MCJ8009876.1 hypothetical protein [Lederbergia wuyishanensis]MDQ0343587.1 NTP pyrophosphatase (non-canonical NTP hydrolase) [Lederbergia wuyishanensis]